MGIKTTVELPIGRLMSNLTMMFTSCFTLGQRGAGGTGWATSNALAHSLKSFRHGGELAGLVGRRPRQWPPPCKLQGGKSARVSLAIAPATELVDPAPPPPGPALQAGEPEREDFACAMRWQRRRLVRTPSPRPPFAKRGRRDCGNGSEARNIRHIKQNARESADRDQCEREHRLLYLYALNRTLATCHRDSPGSDYSIVTA